MEEMSVNRGLVELKSLDKRIEKAINETVFSSFKVGENSVKGYKTVKDYEENVESKYQSITALIKRRESIKSAIVESNAKTVVKIADEKMTVADAIERKNHSIYYEKKLLEKLRRDLNEAVDEIENENEDAKQRLEHQIQMLAGKEGKVRTEDAEATTNFFWKHNKAELIDPIDARKKIDMITKKIDEFLADVDLVLSESNVLTKIKI